MYEWSIERLELSLKYDWKIARNNSQSKVNFIIRVKHNQYLGSGEAAPNIRYGETPETIVQAFNQFKQQFTNFDGNLDAFSHWLGTLQLPNALRLGIESAFVHLLSASTALPVYQILGIKGPEPIATSYSFPIMDASHLKDFYDAHELNRFSLLKIKVSPDNCVALIETLTQITTTPFIVDPNESFTEAEAVLEMSNAIAHTNAVCIEQPMPATLVGEYQKLKPVIKQPLIADESICRDVDFDLLQTQFHGINVKLMKAGGYLSAISLLKNAHQLGMLVMLGCMIETSLGISSALHISKCVPELNFVDLDGFMVIKDEPFGLVKEQNGKLSLA